MKTFPENMKFCYEWRSYQKRALKDLASHLKNGKFHLVAPPGSGKTVLGLEVMARINKPTLIVAPTLAIQQQWKERLTELFLDGEEPEWLSMDCRKPEFVTVTTYQTLHSIFNGKETNEIDEEEGDDSEVERTVSLPLSGNDRTAEEIEAFGFGTLILDEAHHLRTAWWKTLIELRGKLGKSNVVSLTATPPYDVSAMEWQRYIELCGPIDLEISVPELVKEKELCPHQDYVHFSILEGEDLKMILHFREAVHEFVENLINEVHFKELIESHPWITDPMKYVGTILDNPAYFSSLLIYLNYVGSDKYHEALPIIGMEDEVLPAFTNEWLEELLTGLLFNEQKTVREADLLKTIKKDLQRIGAIERKKVSLLSTGKMNKTLMQSVSKLSSIREIVQAEKKLLRHSLRMVVLTDYIRLEDLPSKADDEIPLMRLGVVPIFEMIRRDAGLDVMLGLLTGSLVILPKSAQQVAEKISESHGIAVQWSEMVHDPSYVKLESNAQNRQKIVSVMTEVLSAGEVEVLVGTAALLGEGWDAPCVNSLILASYVGSFMQSNQMRGRAIRVDRNDKNKTASIWHLACVDRDTENLGYDFEMVTRRFRSLVGISEKENVIETGIVRLDLEQHSFTPSKIKDANDTTFRKSSRREDLLERWQKAIYNGKEMTEELVAQRNSLPRPYYLRNSMRGVLWLAGFTALGGAVDSIRFLWNFKEISAGVSIYLGFILGLIIAWPSFSKVIKLYLRHPSVESSMKEIGETIYLSLLNAKVVQTPFTRGMIRVDAGATGAYTCWLMEGTTHEKNMFMKALQEFVDPIENPRYLIVRKAGKFFKKEDVHAVPQEIGRKKEHAEFLQLEWGKRVGDSELIYTRTFEGRKELLAARLKALSAEFIEKSERISGWR